VARAPNPKIWPPKLRFSPPAPITKAVAGGFHPLSPAPISFRPPCYALGLFAAFDKTQNRIYILLRDTFRIADILGQKKISAIMSADLAFRTQRPQPRESGCTPVEGRRQGWGLPPAWDSVLATRVCSSRWRSWWRPGSIQVRLRSSRSRSNAAEMLGVSDRVWEHRIGEGMPSLSSSTETYSLRCPRSSA